MEKNDTDSRIPTGRGGHIAFTVRDEEQHTPPLSIVNPPPEQMDTNFVSLFFTGVILVAVLIVLAALKFQNAKQSPFKTDGFFIKISIVTLLVAVLTCLILISRCLRSSMGEIIYTVLKTAFCFSIIVSPLSLFGLLFVPRNLKYWIGYPVICVIFVIVIACNVSEYMRLIDKKVVHDLESNQVIKEDKNKTHPLVAT